MATAALRPPSSTATLVKMPDAIRRRPFPGSVLTQPAKASVFMPWAGSEASGPVWP